MSEPYARRSMRYPRDDYRLAGGYFATMVLANREPRFGRVEHGVMAHDSVGRMVIDEWTSLPERYLSILLDAFVVMPGHVHGIVFLINHHANDGTSLSEVIRVFKSMTTTRYIADVREHGWPRFDRHLWQPNFYDHIIRNDDDLETRRRHIEANPGRWEAKQRNDL